MVRLLLPSGAFLRRESASAKSTVRADMTLYLSHRMTAEKTAYSFLLRLMQRVLNTAYQALPEHDYKSKKQLARTLCKLLVEEISNCAEALLTTKVLETPKKLD